VLLAGLSAYLASMGLDKADKLASVLTLLVAVAALVVPYLLPTSDGHDPEPRSAQQVANTVVGGHLTQIRDAGGVRVQGLVTSRLPQAPPPKAGPVPEDQGGQYVNGVRVGGHLIQVDGADSDLTIG
jgi:hypothetical protein